MVTVAGRPRTPSKARGPVCPPAARSRPRQRIIPLTWRRIMNTEQDIVFKRCGCTDGAAGRQLAAHCPHLAEPGHGSWYYAVQVATVGGRKARYRRGGFPTREAAITARQAVLDGPADEA